MQFITLPEPTTRGQDDYGFEVNASHGQVVTDDFGIEVTNNPVWAEQRLDPHLALTGQSQANP